MFFDFTTEATGQQEEPIVISSDDDGDETQSESEFVFRDIMDDIELAEMNATPLPPAPQVNTVHQASPDALRNRIADGLVPSHRVVTRGSRQVEDGPLMALPMTFPMRRRADGSFGELQLRSIADEIMYVDAAGAMASNTTDDQTRENIMSNAGHVYERMRNMTYAPDAIIRLPPWSSLN